MKLLALVVVMLLSMSAFAQKHMVEFNADSVTLGTFNFSNSKDRGQDSSENKIWALSGNYAHSVTDHIQAGTQFSYTKFHTASSGHSENLEILVGGIYNLDTDFRKSFYASVYAGWEWGHSTKPNASTEDFVSKFGLGKRIPLSMFNLENVTYSPEVAFKSTNSTKSSSTTEWTQDLQIKFLQFSVFF